ncbi:MAG TPA: hypothetical protein VNY29_10155 [Terriglobales bacterium]|jgi:uncharacterized membrane protein (DUF2068 family)|nr:hypothetical protein [Terriglobales bacterium]
MQRPVWVTSIIILQLLLGMLFAGICTHLLFLIRSPEMKQAADSAEGIAGLKIAVGVIAPMGLLLIVAAFGMWKNKRWSWWFALLTNLGLAIVFVYSSIGDGWADWEMVAMTAVLVALIVFLLLPPVRRFCLRDEPHLPSAAT